MIPAPTFKDQKTKMSFQILIIPSTWRGLRFAQNNTNNRYHRTGNNPYNTNENKQKQKTKTPDLSGLTEYLELLCVLGVY